MSNSHNCVKQGDVIKPDVPACSRSSTQARKHANITVYDRTYTKDAVTSVNLNISMVRYSRRHLVCTADCLHEHEWWILMRSSRERLL